MNNNYIYPVWSTDATSVTERAEAGYVGGKRSSDGTMIMGDKQDQDEPTMTNPPAKPSYFVETVANWPYLTHTEAILFKSYMVVIVGDSLGYAHNKTTPTS